MKKSISFLTLLFLISSMVPLNASVISWQEIEIQEKKMQSWARQMGKDRMIEMGKNKDQNKQLEWIQAFYPYLLPIEFFNRNLYVSCYPSFMSLRKARTSDNLEAWRKCQINLWRESIPPLIEQAIRDLQIQQLKP